MPQTHEQFIAHAGSVASYYGFKPLREVDPAVFRSTVGRASPSFNHAVSMCSQCSVTREREPVLAYFPSNNTAYPPESSLRDAGEFNLHVTGVSQALGDVFVLKTLVAILSDWGAPPARVRINSFGDRDSRDRFAREFSQFVRRRFSDAMQEEQDDAERRAILETPSLLYHSHSAFAQEALADAPRPVHFLSERSRAHLKELLEHLERIDFPYEIDDTLCGDERDPRIVFRVETEPTKDAVVLGGGGGRFDDYAARVAGKRDAAAVHASIYFKKRGVVRSSTAQDAAQPPKVYFVQLGVRAKLQGLSVIDTLRRAQVPVAQTFSASMLSPQLRAAEELGVPFVLIMGEQEARDRTVIVRRVSNSSQTAVPICGLQKYLRTIKV